MFQPVRTPKKVPELEFTSNSLNVNVPQAFRLSLTSWENAADYRTMVLNGLTEADVRF
jgi:hypothetical protein